MSKPGAFEGLLVDELACASRRIDLCTHLIVDILYLSFSREEKRFSMFERRTKIVDETMWLL